MSNFDHQTDTIVKYSPENIPGTPESCHKIAGDLEYASNSLCSLGELMKVTEYDRLEEFTVQGLGHLLIMLGNNLMSLSGDVYGIARKADKQKETNLSASVQ
ncbi:hypothetical protein NMYAN_20350 [Nitrosomonas nitrosa]|uniref:Uncharacterized protein n=1 Tax=Nitrosomonas nitrosa TaxID=52442 RepID=A0A8H9D9X7_9PROT|nr:hypothetical protein [Nitrosomonas nitrosa]CAE6503434.1 hypothetical protein NMYAN_20350 [Nitrosomonas nitrosa]